MSAHLLVELQADSTDTGVPDEDCVFQWVERALLAAGMDRAAEVAVRIVDEPEMQSLNRDFRDKDRPTNVLSFPAGRIEGLPTDEPLPLGDIVICAPVVRAEAEAQGKLAQEHWAHMLVHGSLHLLGYDHIEDDDAARMEQLETDIITGAGLPAPYGDH